MKKLLASAVIAAGLLGSGSAFAQAANTSSATAAGSVTIVRPLTITNTSGLAFGRIVKPRTGDGTVSIANNSNTVVAGSGAVALSGITTSRAVFTVDGEGGQAIGISMPSSMTLSGNGDTIEVTLAPDFGSTETLSGALAGSGSKTLNVGGGFDLPSAQASGAYTGSFTVTVAYQ